LDVQDKHSSVFKEIRSDLLSLFNVLLQSTCKGALFRGMILFSSIQLHVYSETPRNRTQTELKKSLIKKESPFMGLFIHVWE